MRGSYRIPQEHGGIAMGRLVLILTLCAFLTACSSTPEVVIETRYVHIPVLYSPEPPPIERPDLVIDSLNPESDSGDVALAYRATVRQLLQYSRKLELVIDQYGVISEEFEILRAEIERLYPADATPESLPDPE